MGSLPALSDVGDETLARYKQMLELDWKYESYALKPSPPLGCVPGSPANAPAAAEAKEPRGGGADVIVVTRREHLSLLFDGEDSGGPLEYASCPTGALFASIALLAELARATAEARLGSVLVLALDDEGTDPPVVETPRRLRDAPAAAPRLALVRGSPRALEAAAAARGGAHAVVALDTSASTTAFTAFARGLVRAGGDGAASAAGTERFALVHTYSELPFGPFYAERDVPRDAVALRALTLLCASDALAAYCRRHGRAARAEACYAADYAYYDALLAGARASADARALPPDARRYDALFVSGCGPKGLAVLHELAARRPRARFGVVCTAWCTRAGAFAATRGGASRNVELVAPTLDRRALFSSARVVVAPSLWPEAFGLVLVEAGLHGVPAVSTGAGGLREANPDARRNCVDVALVYDALRAELRRGTTLAAEEDDFARDAETFAWRFEPSGADAGPVGAWQSDAPGRRGAPHAYATARALETCSRIAAADTTRRIQVAQLMAQVALKRERGAPDAKTEAMLNPAVDRALRDALGEGADGSDRCGGALADVARALEPAGDEAAAFVARLNELLDDPDEYRRSAATAREGACEHVEKRRGALVRRLNLCARR